MATFSVNQVRQLYVANAYKENLAALKDAGDITLTKPDNSDVMYFQYIGANLDNMRSDLIKIDNITNISVTKAENIATKLKGYTLTLDPNVNGGNPVPGQDYLLRLAFREYIGMSESDQYFKYGMVHAFPNLSASDFYKQLAISLAVNMSKDTTPLVKIYVHSAATKTAPFDTVTGNIEVLPEFASKMDETGNKNPFYSGSAIVNDIDSIIIVEAEQPWNLGTMPQGVIPFSIQPTTVLVDGDQRIWGKVESYDTKTVLPEGQLIADLEYFCMGERGDQYRNVGWPNVIPTKYLVDPSKLYDVINIHYFYQGDGISVQKSEKDIQIAVVRGGDYTNVNAVIKAINAIIPNAMTELS